MTSDSEESTHPRQEPKRVYALSSATMTSNSEDGGNHGCSVVLLDGYDNYEEWMRYLRNIVVGKDLHDGPDGSETYPTDTPSVPTFLLKHATQTPISAPTHRPNLQLDNTSTTPTLPSPLAGRRNEESS